MAADSSESKIKRPFPARVAKMQARKRRKVANGHTGPRETSKGAKRAVRLDALPWKEISMPDHLDDYEGFFGLEEIEDVEVVRDVETGHISFMSNHSTAPATAPTDDENSVDDEEWSGFDDEEDSNLQIPNIEGQQSSGPKAKTTQSIKSASRSNGTFHELTNETDGESEGVNIEAWKDLKLSPDTLAALSTLGFATPTAIQRSAIPEILAGHDVIGKASTGSGKTLAFGIPILEHFLGNMSSKRQAEKAPAALILSPTRELAHQLDKHLTALCKNGIFDGPVIATLTGGLSILKQQRLLKNADIVIATPGRLWEIMSEGQGVMETLKMIKFLVVDEADRLLSQGHFKEMEEILNALDRQDETEDADAPSTKEPSQRQTLVFSATFDKGLQRQLNSKSRPTNSSEVSSNAQSVEYLLTRLNFREEKLKFVDVNPVSHIVSGLRESLVECPAGMDKDLYLYTLLLLLSQSKSQARMLVFTNSVSAVQRLTPFLQNLNLPALALHSSMIQKARLRSVERFTATSSSCSILVATDVAARGLDIPDVQVVIHYHLPRAADTYVHRSGRTARAGQSGSSILICAPEEVAGVRRLVAKVHASSSRGDDAKQAAYIRTLDLNRKIVSRLRPRATLAKKLADTQIAKEKQSKEDEFLKAAAEELGVDYDSDSFAAEGARGKRGRGAGREKKAKEAKAMTKAEVASMRTELKALLQQRVNVGVSERYLTSGNVDIDELLRQQADGSVGSRQGHEFLGTVQGLGLEDV